MGRNAGIYRYHEGDVYKRQHYIREKVVEQLVLESMQRVLWYVQSYEKLFAQRQLAEFGEKQKKEFAEKRRELDKSRCV